MTARGVDGHARKVVVLLGNRNALAQELLPPGVRIEVHPRPPVCGRYLEIVADEATLQDCLRLVLKANLAPLRDAAVRRDGEDLDVLAVVEGAVEPARAVGGDDRPGARVDVDRREVVVAAGG